MKENVDYKFREDLDDFDPELLVPIELLTGEFTGAIVQFGEAFIVPNDKGEQRGNLNFQFFIVNNEARHWNKNPVFVAHIGKILEQILIEEEAKAIAKQKPLQITMEKKDNDT